MENNSSKFKIDESDSLKQMRDELKVQFHLFNAEMRGQWEKLENDWRLIQRSMGPTKVALNEAVKGVNESIDPLFKTVKSAYEQIKRDLKSAHRDVR